MAVQKTHLIITGIWRWIHDDSFVSRATDKDTGAWLNTSGVSLETHDDVLHAPHYERHNHKDDTAYPIPNLADIYNPLDEPDGVFCGIGAGTSLSFLSSTVTNMDNRICLTGTVDGVTDVGVMYFDAAEQDGVISWEQSTERGEWMQLGGKAQNYAWMSEQLTPVVDLTDLTIGSVSTLAYLGGKVPYLGILTPESFSNINLDTTIGTTTTNWKVGNMTVTTFDVRQNITIQIEELITSSNESYIRLKFLFPNGTDGTKAVRQLLGRLMDKRAVDVSGNSLYDPVSGTYIGAFHSIKISLVPIDKNGTVLDASTIIHSEDTASFIAPANGEITIPEDNSIYDTSGGPETGESLRGIQISIGESVSDIELFDEYEVRITFYATASIPIALGRHSHPMGQDSDTNSETSHFWVLPFTHVRGKGTSKGIDTVGDYSIYDFDVTVNYPTPAFKCTWSLSRADDSGAELRIGHSLFRALIFG